MIHTAFNHDFSKFLDSVAQDQRVIEALGTALERTHTLAARLGTDGPSLFADLDRPAYYA